PPLLHEAALKLPPKSERVARGENNADVPDFIGLSLRESVEKARSLNIKVEMHGNGYVVKQSPLPGAAWNKNGTLTLNLQGCTMQLDVLLQAGEVEQTDGNLARAVAGLAYDSRRVKPGFVFFAVPGARSDGHEFIND